MNHCESCGADVVGQWRTCPLCRIPLRAEHRSSGTPEVTQSGAEAYPAPPLRFNRKQLRKVLILLSVLAVAGSFATQLLVPNLIAPVRTVWLSLATLWLVVLAAARRRRQVGGLVVWLVVLLSLAAVAWDLVTVGGDWAVTWAIPAICTFANLALGIVVWVVRLEPAEHIVNTALVLLFGLTPALFVALGWVSVMLPSLICVGFSVALLTLMIIFRHKELRDSLHRRLQV